MGEDEHLFVNAQIIPVIRLGGNERRSITKAIFYLRTSVKLVEQKANSFGSSNGIDRNVGQREGSCHQGATIGGENCPTTLREGS